MENVVIIPVGTDYTEFMSLPSGVHKNSRYYNLMQGRSFAEANLCKKDGCIYYSHRVFKIKKSKNGFYRQNTSKNGFTLDEKGKLSVWYGKNIFELQNIWAVFSHFNMNWLNAKLVPYITKTIAAKILTGKLTGNLDVVKAYIKMMRLNCSPKFMLQAIEENCYVKPQLLSMLAVAKDQNHLLEKIIKEKEKDTQSYLLNDLVKQAHILDKKVDYTWSYKRMHEEHQQWTKEIMEAEMIDMEDITARWALPYLEFKYPGFTLLTTKKEVYAEGKIMNHCVYTNYWSNVQHGNYLVYQVDFFDERATLGLNVYYEIKYNQCYGYTNKSISNNLKDHVDNFIQELNIFHKQKLQPWMAETAKLEQYL